MNEQLLLRPEQAAAILGLGRTKLYELLATNALESYTIGRRRLVPRDALDTFVARLREEHAVSA